MIPFKSLRRKIEGQRNTVVAAIKRLKREDPFSTNDRSLIVEPGTDASDLFGHERVVILENQLKRELKEIENALVKLKKGTYGICENCKEKINEARLNVKPAAIYCMKCEKEFESKRK